MSTEINQDSTLVPLCLCYILEIFLIQQCRDRYRYGYRYTRCEGTVMATISDDVAILTTDTNIEDTTERLQTFINAVNKIGLTRSAIN